ncbi:MAG: hypothetical protein ACR2QM_13955, partial [Longimicrobiales bacterium]
NPTVAQSNGVLDTEQLVHRVPHRGADRQERFRFDSPPKSRVTGRLRILDDTDASTVSDHRSCGGWGYVTYSAGSHDHDP